MLFPLVTGAYYYATEARPYGLVLGFSGLALLCWQAATEKDRRLLSLAGLAASLAAAISCHYHAVFVLAALGFAEAVRSRTLRRLDLPLWAALSLGVAPLLAFFPLIRRAIGYSTTFWAKSRWMSAPEFYYSLLRTRGAAVDGHAGFVRGVSDDDERSTSRRSTRSRASPLMKWPLPLALWQSRL